jgi:hypothetical protein
MVNLLSKYPIKNDKSVIISIKIDTSDKCQTQAKNQG